MSWKSTRRSFLRIACAPLRMKLKACSRRRAKRSRRCRKTRRKNCWSDPLIDSRNYFNIPIWIVIWLRLSDYLMIKNVAFLCNLCCGSDDYDGFPLYIAPSDVRWSDGLLMNYQVLNANYQDKTSLLFRLCYFCACLCQTTLCLHPYF